MTNPKISFIDNYNNNTIELPNVNGEILGKIIQYCEHHRNDKIRDSQPSEKSSEMDPWDEEFCNVDKCTIFELILAANYLDIKSLLDATCKKVANMIREKTPEEIRKLFNMENDPDFDEEMSQSKKDFKSFY